MTRDDERLSGHPEVVEALAGADAAGSMGRRSWRPRATADEVAAWQEDYDAGCPVTVIAEAAGRHPTTIAAWITTTGRTGRRPMLTPDDAITAVQEAGGVIRRAAAQLDVSPATVRLALYRAGMQAAALLAALAGLLGAAGLGVWALLAGMLAAGAAAAGWTAHGQLVRLGRAR